MNLTIERIAEAFSRHEFAKTYPYLAADVRWNIVGGRQVIGRDAVIRTCEDSDSYLKSVTTNFSAFRTMVGADFVVTDSTAEYVDADGESSVVASCDLYRFTDGLAVEITSYTIELG